MIKKINPSGKDTLRRNGYQPPMGDVKYSKTSTFYETANASNKISLFVRYTDIAEQLSRRKINISRFGMGAEYFTSAFGNYGGFGVD